MDEALDQTLARIDDLPDPSRSSDGEARTFRLVAAASLELRPPKYLVRDHLEAESLAQIYGDPSSGKSFAAIDLACCIATGVEWHGRAVDPGTVIYIAGEGHGGLQRRFRAWEIRNDQSLQGAPLYVSTAPAGLCDIYSAGEVMAAVDEVAQINASPVLVVVDTLARNFGPGDENSTQDMSGFIHAVDLIRTRYQCTVLLVHHTGHTDKTRARGAMALKGALDAEYRIEKDESGTVRLEASKMKEAPLPEPMAFELREVELGIQDDLGREVTSAVLDPVGYEPPKPSSKPEPRGKWQRVAIEQLQKLYDEHRQNIEAAGQDPARARVMIDDWRSACLEAGMPRQRFFELKENLPQRGLVVINGHFVELP